MFILNYSDIVDGILTFSRRTIFHRVGSSLFIYYYYYYYYQHSDLIKCRTINVYSLPCKETAKCPELCSL